MLGSGRGTSDAFAILKLLGDDNKYTQKLAELNAVAQKAVEAQAKAQAIRTSANQDVALAKQAHSNAATIYDQGVAAKEAAEAQVAEVAKREAALETARKQHADNVAARKAELEKAAEDSGAILASHTNALAAVKVALAELTQKHDAAQSAYEELQVKIAATKAEYAVHKNDLKAIMDAINTANAVHKEVTTKLAELKGKL